MKAFILMLLLAAPCYGQIVVSDQLPPPVKYPAEVYRMSDAQFFQWATEFNAKQVADLEVKRAKITESEWLEGSETVTNQDFFTVGNRGNFNGYGRSNFYRPNYQYGFSNESSVTIPRRWPNPAYSGPGPLIIVNPYCRPTEK